MEGLAGGGIEDDLYTTAWLRNLTMLHEDFYNLSVSPLSLVSIEDNNN